MACPQPVQAGKQSPWFGVGSSGGRHPVWNHTPQLWGEIVHLSWRPCPHPPRLPRVFAGWSGQLLTETNKKSLRDDGKKITLLCDILQVWSKSLSKRSSRISLFTSLLPTKIQKEKVLAPGQLFQIEDGRGRGHRPQLGSFLQCDGGGGMPCPREPSASPHLESF